MVMSKDTLVLAHYYTISEVQQMADHVGDSMDKARIPIDRMLNFSV